MKVKRYLVDDLPEAVQMIRSELGSDAMILNTKEVRTGGFLGMFRKKRVEVIAAVDEASRKAARTGPARPAVALEPGKASFAVTDNPEVGPATVPGRAVRGLYARGGGLSAAKSGAGLAVAAPASDTPSPIREQNGGVPFAGDAGIAAAETALAAAPSTGAQDSGPRHADPSPASVPAGPDDASALLQELRSMKDLMARMARQQSLSSMPESVLKWSRRLAEQGVDPVHVEAFAEEVRSRLNEAETPDEAAAYEAAKEVLRSWLIPCAGGGIAQGTRVVHFVGPTGVGKTTTIAKLAADQSFSHRRTVGFITADTYRISAVDQLRTYADILNSPLEVVFSPGELTRAYKRLAERDLLFMDTAGRNYRNELFVSEVNSLLAPGERTETFLVLSLTHKYADMRPVVSHFAKYGVRRLLLTKADETDTFGALLNLVREFSFPISYITCGQTVPDDIRLFDPEEWTLKLLGEPAHE